MSGEAIEFPALGPDDPKHLAHLLLRASRQHQNRGFVVAHDLQKQDVIFVRYPALLEQAKCILGGFQARGCSIGARIAVLLERPDDAIPTLWACILGGYLPCMVRPIQNDRERWIKHLADVDILLDHPLFVERADGRTAQTTSSVAIEELREHISSEYVHVFEPSDPAILILTSGSTGQPKAVTLTHRNILCSLIGKSECQRLTSADVTLNWISFDHVAALLETHLLPLFAGAEQVHVEPTRILADPLMFLRIISRMRVSVSFVPNFLLGQINSALQSASCDDTEKGRLSLELSCVRHIISGGEANRVETVQQFLKLLAPYGLAPDVLWPAFGMTETCAGSIYSSEFQKYDAGEEFASVGRPIKHLQMRVTDDVDTPLVAGKVGELQLRGPMIFDCYYNNSDATLNAFTQDGWFRTGDLGRIDDGRLRLVGRSKDSIIVNGTNYFSQELEASLEQIDGIAPSYVAVFPTRPTDADTEHLVVAFATTFESNDETRLHKLMLAVRSRTLRLWGFSPTTILPLPKEFFPKTSLGKIQRSLMRQHLQSGIWGMHLSHAQTVMQRESGAYIAPEGPAEVTIAKILADTSGVAINHISATMSLFDLAGTSLDIIRITQRIAQHFGIDLTVTIVFQHSTVRHLAVHIDSARRTELPGYNPIVALQSAGDKTPLFCIHPGNGGILIYVNLAKHLIKERPLYALRPRGFGKGETCFGTFREMVDTYVRAILRRQPHGPYSIIGYSLGGVIAFEVAKEITERGQRVNFLGCINCAPCMGAVQADLIAVATNLGWLLGLVDAQQMKQLNTDLREMPFTTNPCEKILLIASRDRLSELDLDLDKFSDWAKVAHSILRLTASHVTTGVMNAMTVFHPISYDEFPISRLQWQEKLLLWKNFAPNARYVEVPGSHFTLMSPENAVHFHEILSAEIDHGVAIGRI